MSLNNCCVSAPTVINVSTLTSSSCLTEVYRAVHAVEGVACNLDGLVGDVFKQQSFRKPCDTFVQAIVTCNMGLIVASLGYRLSYPTSTFCYISAIISSQWVCFSLYMSLIN